MPLYEYKCKSCKRQFEVLQKMSEEPLEECLYCSGRVEKLISRSSFQLKGSGWYVTDYKNDYKRKASRPDSDDNGKSSPSPTIGKDKKCYT